MEVQVKVIDVKTIHTNTDVDTKDMADQPMIEVTLETTVSGKTEQIKFTEVLSNIAHLNRQGIKNYFKSVITNYVQMAYAGQRAVDSVSKEWLDKDAILGLQFTLDI